jgi:hypothetical protein
MDISLESTEKVGLIEISELYTSICKINQNQTIQFDEKNFLGDKFQTSESDKAEKVKLQLKRI